MMVGTLVRSLEDAVTLAGPPATMNARSGAAGSRSREDVGFRRGHSSWRRPIEEEGLQDWLLSSRGRVVVAEFLVPNCSASGPIIGSTIKYTGDQKRQCRSSILFYHY
jgi:hypothetical protein